MGIEFTIVRTRRYIYIHVQNVYTMYIKAVVHFESVLKKPWNRQKWFRYEVCCCCYLFRSQAHIFIFFMSKRKSQNPWSLQGQTRQFADRRDDSTQTMIVDKFYHFHPHRGIMLIADPSWCPHNEQMYFINLRVQSISVV